MENQISPAVKATAKMENSLAVICEVALNVARKAQTAELTDLAQQAIALAKKAVLITDTASQVAQMAQTTELAVAIVDLIAEAVAQVALAVEIATHTQNESISYIK